MDHTVRRAAGQQIATLRFTARLGSRKLKSLTKGLRRDGATGLWIFSPLFIPGYSPRMTCTGLSSDSCDFLSSLLVIMARY